MTRPDNPFQVTRLPGEREFCDRRAELERLRHVWNTPGGKLVVYGERRLGKSATLEIAAFRARRAGRNVVIFNLATAIDARDAVHRLLHAVQQAVGRSWKTVLQDLVARLRFTITMRPGTAPGGLPEFTLGVEPGAAARAPAAFTDALDALEAELARRRIRLGLGIDEFQRLLEWGGEDVEWALKAAFEKHHHISYVLAGSARSLIEEMVSDKHRALWKSVETMAIGPIASAELERWIVRRSRASGIALTADTAAAIVRLAGPRTRDVIVLAAATWEDARTHGHGGSAEQALAAQVEGATDLHARVWTQRTARERRILRLLAAEPSIAPMAHDVRIRYALGASSTVAKALGVLVGDEVLARSGGAYVFDDPFFREWVARATAADIGLG